jgi:hypothetical protein
MATPNTEGSGLRAISPGKCATCRERYEQGDDIEIRAGRTYHVGCAPARGAWSWSSGPVKPTGDAGQGGAK